MVTELKKDGETPAFKVRLSGKAYNRKNMKPSRSPSKLPLVRGSMLTAIYRAGQRERRSTFWFCPVEGVLHSV